MFILFQVDGDSSLSPVVAPKKAKPSDAGGDKVMTKTFLFGFIILTPK